VTVDPIERFAKLVATGLLGEQNGASLTHDQAIAIGRRVGETLFRDLAARLRAAVAVVEAARRLSDKRTLTFDRDGFEVSKREMRYVDEALAAYDAATPAPEPES
jgi:hypothetical protein